MTPQQLAERVEQAKAGILLGGGIHAYEATRHTQRVPDGHSGKGGVGSEAKYKQAMKHKAKILSLLKKQPMTCNELAKVTGKSAHLIRSQVQALRKGGKVTANGRRGKSALWEIVKPTDKAKKG